MPSAALMSSFSAEVETPEAIEPLLRRLVHLPLRQLTIGALWDPMLEVKFEPRWLTDHAIERLKLMQRPITQPPGPEVSRLTQLWIAPGRPDDLHRLFEPPGAFPRLSELNVDCQFLERRHGNETSHFAEVLNGAATPALRALHCRYARVELQASLLERVATSKILPRLEAFSFNPWSNDSVQLATVPERHRAAFAHLR